MLKKYPNILSFWVRVVTDKQTDIDENCITHILIKVISKYIKAVSNIPRQYQIYHGDIKYTKAISNISRRYQIYQGDIKYIKAISNIKKRIKTDKKSHL